MWYDPNTKWVPAQLNEQVVQRKNSWEDWRSKDNNCEVQTGSRVKGLATLYLVHKMANLPLAGRASDTVQGEVRLQLKLFKKDDFKMEEMQRKGTEIIRRVEILLSRKKIHKSCC